VLHHEGAVRSSSLAKVVGAVSIGLLGLVVMFAVATARQQSRLRSVWYDEAFTIVWMRADWEHFWQLARRDAGNGVGYIVALKLLDWLWPGSTVPLGLWKQFRFSPGLAS
jgi:hypothetical protein